jgi:hypothetical protein
MSIAAPLESSYMVKIRIGRHCPVVSGGASRDWRDDGPLPQNTKRVSAAAVRLRHLRQSPRRPHRVPDGDPHQRRLHDASHDAVVRKVRP